MLVSPCHARYVPAMVQEIVCHVIAYISEYPTRIGCDSSVPVVEKDEMREFVKRRCKNDEQRGRHYETVPIHREIMMDTMEEEMQRQPDSVIRKISAF